MASSAEDNNHHRASAKQIYSSSDLWKDFAAAVNWRCGHVSSGTTDLRLACRVRSILETRGAPRSGDKTGNPMSPRPLLVRLAHIQRLRKVCIAGLCGVIYRLQHRAMGCGVDWMSMQVVADCWSIERRRLIWGADGGRLEWCLLVSWMAEDSRRQGEESKLHAGVWSHPLHDTPPRVTILARFRFQMPCENCWVPVSEKPSV
jgi:hypothetical protein